MRREQRLLLLLVGVVVERSVSISVTISRIRLLLLAHGILRLLVNVGRLLLLLLQVVLYWRRLRGL